MEQTLLDARQGAQRFLRNHRLGLVAGSVALLAGFGITAVAVAPLVPDPSLLPQRLVAESVVPEGMDRQLAALAAQELTLTRSDTSRDTDTADVLLARLGVRDPAASLFIRTDSTARLLLAGRGGKMVQASTDESGNLEQLVARYPADKPELARSHFTRLTLSRIGARWLARLDTAPLTAQTRMSSGTIRNTLFAATDESGLPDAVAAQLAEIFSTDIDFHRELRRGDTFSVLYESLMADGEPVAWNDGAGRVLAAEFVNAGEKHRAVWFTSAEGRGAYYDLNGRSKKRTFLASPMEFSRVSSGFAMRLHPLLQTWRAHLGVDYAAPIGTAVRSVAEGVVDFAGQQNGYGNVVEVRHADERTTLYAHLSRIEVKKGQRVEQGQHIGAVGMTGWATGPHLHFEFRVAGEHRDPLVIAKGADSSPVDARSSPQFRDTVRGVQVGLQLARSFNGQRTELE